MEVRDCKFLGLVEASVHGHPLECKYGLHPHARMIFAAKLKSNKKLKELSTVVNLLFNSHSTIGPREIHAMAAVSVWGPLPAGAWFGSREGAACT